MKFTMQDGLPFITVELIIKGIKISVNNVLIDTGSATSLFSVDYLFEYGIEPEPTDRIRRMTGIGGEEFVFEKLIDKLSIDNLIAEHPVIQVGAMDYGFHINGIIGSNILLQTNARINFKEMLIGK